MGTYDGYVVEKAIINFRRAGLRSDYDVPYASMLRDQMKAVIKQIRKGKFTGTCLRSIMRSFWSQNLPFRFRG